MYEDTLQKAAAPELLEITSPFPMEQGRLRLLEPAGTSESELCERLLKGNYGKPFILDSNVLRFLHFDFNNIQSAMRRDDPNTLCLAYTRQMMAFLLFNPDPRRILLLGLGGGSIAKFCYSHLQSAKITVLEIDPNVIALREEFSVPADDRRFEVVQGDGVDYVTRGGPRQDIILIDACDKFGVAPALAAPAFYSNIRRRLAAGGVVVINLCGSPYDCASHFARIQGVFGPRVLSLPVREDGNLIVLGFRPPDRGCDWKELALKAQSLERRFGLDFGSFVLKMARAAGAA
ncbi:MAG TPA: fused MFS/spermidine synthase [Steroidobacteraceae bacterium]|nr:fused MFS/spermidine synthase [Steroidobacteraceae bacterium]